MAAESGPGRVILVGAGPGDPGLVGARAREAIAEADTILYDRLVGPGLLDGARPDAELVYVGKQGGGAAVPQERTEEMLLEHARAGRVVVRLKGGDPFVFGRGGEEALTLRAAGIPFEVVPGVTAGLAAPAYAGIPVTHRGLSTAVALVTGHTRRGTGGDDDAHEAEIDWAALAAFPGTLVFYMGVSALPVISERLIAAGRPASEPAAIVEAGTLPGQRTVVATLETIAEEARREQVRAPSVTVIGAVAALAGELGWRAPQPLAGRTVAVTRARAQASGLARRLAALGARAIEAPAIRVRPLAGPALDPAPYDLVCVTSANGVAGLFERLAAADPPRDARALAGARVAAIGPATVEALAARGVLADVVPERAVAESLAAALEGAAVRRALVVRGTQARDVLPEALAAGGAEVDTLDVYETVPEAAPPGVVEEALEADYITFTSSSTVRYFLDAAGGPERIGSRTRLVSIGPLTTEALRERGLEPHVEAATHDVEGIVAAVLDDAAGVPSEHS
ncbi:MAG TPA: uroporphyrinogen-III C-methyltransferase [Solirubrobacteraceae bacterium]|nr:uroporphyrinogen-III C-methyltransferase [Solirubrobacteraceae bacterium]